MRLLVTGGSGFVGGHVVTRARPQFDVTATFHSHEPVYNGVVWRHMDLGSEASIQHVLEQSQPQAVIHTAAWSSPDACEAEREKAFHLNATATEVLAECCAAGGIRLIYCSTDMVFDGQGRFYDESHAAAPANEYGRSKLMGERFIGTLMNDFVIARLALVYGRPALGGSSFSEHIKARLKAGETMPLFVDQYRTPVWVEDLADALLELAGNDFRGVIHLGGATRCDRLAFGRQLCALQHLDDSGLCPVSMADVTFKAPRPADVSLNTGLARQILKSPLRGIEEGLKHV